MANEQAQSELTKQQFTILQFLTLLHEVNAMGQEGFAGMIDAASEEELTALLQSCNQVRTHIAKFKTKVG